MSTRSRDLDYAQFAKSGFLVGVALLAFGLLGTHAAAVLQPTVPSWEATLFTGAEFAGILVALFSPIVFGVVLPLTE